MLTIDTSIIQLSFDLFYGCQQIAHSTACKLFSMYKSLLSPFLLSEWCEHLSLFDFSTCYMHNITLIFIRLLECWLYSLCGITVSWEPWQIDWSEYCFLLSLDVTQKSFLTCCSRQLLPTNRMGMRTEINFMSLWGFLVKNNIIIIFANMVRSTNKNQAVLKSS